MKFVFSFEIKSLMKNAEHLSLSEIILNYVKTLKPRYDTILSDNRVWNFLLCDKLNCKCSSEILLNS